MRKQNEETEKREVESKWRTFGHYQWQVRLWNC